MSIELKAKKERKLDGVQMAVLNKRMEAICRKMSNTLLRTGRSGVLNSARDFSCCLVTGDNSLLSVNESLPIHVLRGADMMAASMKEFHPELRRGDAFMHNSPYHGGSHAADHTTLVPVIDDDGIHRFTMVAKAHQADCGNSIPTTYHGGAKDVYQEGALIFPAIRIQENYKDIDDIIRMCKMRIRVPDQWWGDYLAALGAARIGEREILALGSEVGWETLEQFALQWFDYSEQLMISAVRNMPGGTKVVHTRHDPFPGMEEGVDIKVEVKVDTESAMIEVDLRDNPDCLPCGLNLSQACAETSALLGVFNSVPADVPTNQGSFRRVDIKLRENCVVGIPKHPTSCSVATTNIADRVGNATQRAIAELGDGYGMAAAAAIIPPSIGVISGSSEMTGGPYVNQIFLGWGGGAAAPHNDAWLTLGHIGNAGLSYLDSIELDEMRFPMLVKGRHFVTDSGGAGRTRGGAGVFCEFGPTDGEMEVGYVSDGNETPAEGVRGGGPGGCANQFRRDPNGDLHPLESCEQAIIPQGHTIVSYSCGGGGYGDPNERDVNLVVDDLNDRWISEQTVTDVYGVILNDDGSVDINATDKVRQHNLKK
tara:strand:- start:25044 stop:26831 length:1788 start_codon:yes stop_codon:yes gene_type:complete